MKTVPIRPKKTSITERLAALKRRLRKIVMSIIGCCTLALPGGECGQDGVAHRERTEDGGVGPAALGGLDETPHDGRQPGDRQHRSDHVDAGSLRVAGLGDEQLAEEQRRDHDRDVDEEDALPAEVVEQQAAGDRAEGDAEPRDRSPGSDRLRSLVLREDVGEDRQGRRHDRRGAHTHERAGGDQLVRATGHRGQDRAAAEDQQAGEQEPAPTEAIAESAADQEQAGEDEQVAVHDPRRLARVGTQLGAE